MVNIFIFLGYIGAVAIALHTLYHFFQTIVQKKKLLPGHFDMIVYLTSHLLLLVYSISVVNYILIIFFGATTVWTVAGYTDFLKRKK